ncbi:ribosomal protein S18-alanine N-acetyltransferase [Acidobacteriota bacterium]
MKTVDLFLDTLTSRDLEPLVELENRCFPFPWTKKALESELKKNSSIAARARGGALVGYLFFLLAWGKFQLINIAVDPAHRRKGIATLMLNDLVRRATARGIGLIVLEVRPSNTEAIRLYEKFAFRVTGTRSGYYSDGEDCLLMERHLENEDIDNGA